MRRLNHQDRPARDGRPARLVVHVALAALMLAASAVTASDQPIIASLPPISGAKLQAAIDGLPNDEVTGALVLVRGNKGEWQGVSGVADLESGKSIPHDARFRIGSMTKTFTAVVALQLVAEGKLDLDRSLRDYLPDLFSADYRRITVRQVLTYTSGINGTATPAKRPDWFFAHRYDHWDKGSQIDLSRPPAFEPGTKQRYGNPDYIVAGLLIEAVSGRTWAEEVTRRIIEPLGLRGTRIPGEDIHIEGPHAHGYERVETSTGARWEDVTDANMSLQWSAASMISTADDLDRFMVALFEGRLVPAPQLVLMFTVPSVPRYDGDDDSGNDEPAEHSAGLSRVQLGPLTVWGKSGDRPGYNSAMAATRDLSRRLVYSTNTIRMGGWQTDISKRITAAAFFGR